MNAPTQLGSAALQIANVLAWATSVLACTVLLGFLAFYILTGPSFYLRVLRRVPLRYQARVGHIVGPVASTLRGWILGRLVSMTAVGASTALGLYLLKIPYPVPLGLIAAMLGLIPNVGPLLSVVPAAALAFTVSPVHVLYVVGLYLGIGLVESLLLTPWIEKKTVGVPPTLGIVGQLVAGAIAGLPGLIIATPIIALIIMLVRRLRPEAKAPPPNRTTDRTLQGG